MSATSQAEKDANTAKYWLNQLNAADKRVKKWFDSARIIEQIYEAEKKTDNAFNILYSNTETLLPALYNTLPRPVAQRRFKDADPVSKAVCDTLVRALEYSIDSPDAQYEPFDDVIRSATLGALVPGLGITWFRYDFESEPVPNDDIKEGIAEEGTQYEKGDETGEAQQDVPQEKVTYEAVCAQNVSYRDFRWGDAKKWANVPWVARRHIMTQEDVEDQFGRDVAPKVVYEVPSKQDDDEKPDTDNSADDQVTKVAEVWEIWHKSTREVLFISPQYKEGPLAEPKDDPLGLSGFFPCPEPLQFTAKVTSLVPTPLYTFYETQAKELNKVTLRISRVMNAMKVRGFYNGQLNEISKLLEKDDNTLIPAPSATAFEGTNLSNQIWLMPLQELAAVLQQLLMNRQQIKQTIYEVTGISDILRGSTVASETATAQNLKSQWGTLRLKRSQKRVQTYVRAGMRIMTEIIAQKFSMQSLAEITGLPYMQPEEKQQAQQQLSLLRQKMLAQPPSPGPAPGQGPPQPDAAPAPQQPDPMQQQMQQLQQQVQQIDWGQVMTILRSNILRGYKIDIETNSTIDADATEDRENINELMTALAQVMQAFGPAVQEGAMPMPAFRAIMLAIARRYEFGSEVEDELNAMPQQLPQKPDPAAQKAQAEIQQIQMDGQNKQQLAQLNLQMEMMKAENARAEMQQKAELNAAKHQQLMQKMARDEQLARAEHTRKMQEMMMQASMPQQVVVPQQPRRPNGKPQPRRPA